MKNRPVGSVRATRKPQPRSTRSSAGTFKWSSRILSSDTLLLACVSAAGYLFAFFYELGFLHFYALDTRFIRINTVTIIASMSGTVVVFIPLYGYFEGVLEELSRPGVKLTRVHIVQAASALIGVTLFIGAILGYENPLFYLPVFVLLGLVGFFLLFGCVIHWYRTGWPSRKRRWGRRLADSHRHGAGQQSYVGFFAGVLVLAFTISFISYLGGYREARSTDRNYVLTMEDSSRWLILRSSGGTLLIARLGKTGLTITGMYRFLDYKDKTISQIAPFAGRVPDPRLGLASTE